MIQKYMAYLQTWLQTLEDNLPEGKSLTVYTGYRSRAAVPEEILVDGRPPVPRIKVTQLSYDSPVDRTLNEGGRGLYKLAYSADKHILTSMPAPKVISIVYQIDIYADTEDTVNRLLEGSYLEGKIGLLQKFGSANECIVQVYCDEILEDIDIRLLLQAGFNETSELEIGTEPAIIRLTSTIELDGYVFRPYTTEPPIHRIVVDEIVAESGDDLEAVAEEFAAGEIVATKEFTIENGSE